MKYQFIAEHAAKYPVRRQCQVLTVAESGYYVWLKGQPRARQRADEQLLLFYLKDKSRSADAAEQSKVLASLRNEDKRFYPESRLADAYLAAGKGDMSVAKTIIGAEQTRFNDELKGAWQGLYQDLRSKVYGEPRPRGPRQDGTRPGIPGPDSRPPGDQR